MGPRLYDAHNHLHDDRLAPFRKEIIAALEQENVAKLVVNGSREEDWPAVLELAGAFPAIIPSFGYHPWYLKERTSGWQDALVHFLDAMPSAVGEIGLDHWIKEYDPDEQTELFVAQLRLAAQRNLPVSIHCLQAWGKLLDILQTEPLPKCGFVLHSFGGSREMIGPLVELGAYFSMPGYFAHERKKRQSETFRHVPADRLLLETDAPDQLLPEEIAAYRLRDAQGKPINHPANLAAVYRFAAELLSEPLPHLAERVENNFLRLFGGLLRPFDSGSRSS